MYFLYFEFCLVSIYKNEIFEENTFDILYWLDT